MQYTYGQDGPGGGSLPEYVMRTGTIAPFNPLHVRHDISEKNVGMETRIPVGWPPGVAQYVPAPVPAAPAAAPAPAPAATAGYFGYGLGYDEMGAWYTLRDDRTTMLISGVGSMLLGIITGAAVGGEGRRVKGAGVGALVGAGAGTLAALVAQRISDRTVSKMPVQVVAPAAAK
jgi:hypothetical protein